MKWYSYPLLGLIAVLGIALALLFCLAFVAVGVWEAIARLFLGTIVRAEVWYAVAGHEEYQARFREELRRFGMLRPGGGGYRAHPTPRGYVTGCFRSRHLKRLHKRSGIIQIDERGRLGYFETVGWRMSPYCSFAV